MIRTGQPAEIQKLLDIFRELESNAEDETKVDEKLREAEVTTNAIEHLVDQKSRDEIILSTISLWNSTTHFATAHSTKAISIKLRVSCVATAALFLGEDADLDLLKQVMSMCLKTTRDLLVVNNVNAAEECVVKLRSFAERLGKKIATAARQTASADSTLVAETSCYERLIISATIIEVELLAKKNDQESALNLGDVLVAKMVSFPDRAAHFAILSHNLAVEAFTRKQFFNAARWLKSCYKVSKHCPAMRSKVGATLRMFAQVALEHEDVNEFIEDEAQVAMDYDARAQVAVNLRAALQAIELANREECTANGLHLKALILMKMTSDQSCDLSDADKLLWRELFQNEKLDLKGSLRIVLTQFEENRTALYTHSLSVLADRFGNTPNAYCVRLMFLESVLRSCANPEVVSDQMRTTLNSTMATLLRDAKSVQQSDLPYQHRVQTIIWKRAEAALTERQFSIALTWFNYAALLAKQVEEVSGGFAQLSPTEREKLGWHAENVGLLHANRACCYLELAEVAKARDALKSALSHDPFASPSDAASFIHLIAFRINLLDQTPDTSITSLKKALTASIDNKLDFAKSRTHQVLYAIMHYLLASDNKNIKSVVLESLLDILMGSFAAAWHSDASNCFTPFANQPFVAKKDSSFAAAVLDVLKQAICALLPQEAAQKVENSQFTKVLKHVNAVHGIVCTLNGLEGNELANWNRELVGISMDSLQWCASVPLFLIGCIERGELAFESENERLNATLNAYDATLNLLSIIPSDRAAQLQAHNIKLVVTKLCLKLAQTVEKDAKTFCHKGLTWLRQWANSKSTLSSTTDESHKALFTVATELEFFIIAEDRDEASKCIRQLEVQLSVESSLGNRKTLENFVSSLEAAISCAWRSATDRQWRNEIVIRLAKLLILSYQFLLAKIEHGDQLCTELNEKRTEAIRVAVELLFEQLTLSVNVCGFASTLSSMELEGNASGPQLSQNEKRIVECCDLLINQEEHVNVKVTGDDAVTLIMTKCWNHGVQCGMMSDDKGAEFWCSLAIRILNFLSDKTLVERTQSHLWKVYGSMLHSVASYHMADRDSFIDPQSVNPQVLKHNKN